MSDMFNSAMGGVTDKQTFGAAVVTKTLDYMNGASSGPAPFDKQTFGAAVVTKTLDYMNSGKHRVERIGEQYDFLKAAHKAAYVGKGSIMDSYM